MRFLVKEGDEVKEGTPIVVLEAMKMENDIVAPCAGKIKSLVAKPGDKVRGGVVLAIIG
jgi:biotin carboxyl carrier protein